MLEFGKRASTITRSVGSKVSSPAMEKAVRVSSTPARSAVSTSRSSLSATIHPGSAAGLQDAKSVHLTANGSGYSDPNTQRARTSSRNGPQPVKQATFNLPSKSRNFSSSDYRLTTSDKSSISRIKKIMEN